MDTNVQESAKNALTKALMGDVNKIAKGHLFVVMNASFHAVKTAHHAIKFAKLPASIQNVLRNAGKFAICARSPVKINVLILNARNYVLSLVIELLAICHA